MNLLKKSILYLLLLFSFLSLSSCATIFAGRSQDILFESNEEARIYIDDEYIGKTPVTYRLEKKAKYKGVKRDPYFTVTIELGDYIRTYTIGSGISGWYWISLASSILVIPAFIDLLNFHVMYKFPAIIRFNIIREGE